MAFTRAPHWLAVAVLGLGLPLLAPTMPSLAEPGVSADSRVVIPTLTSVRASHVGDVDRVVFGFRDGLPEDVLFDWVDVLRRDGSGLPVRVAGTKVLAVVFRGVDAHDQNGSTIRARKAFALPNVITAVHAGDFEATVTVGLGVQKRTSYTVATLQNPDRVVVDVRAAFPTSTRRVWFVDTEAVNTGTGPYFVPRQRPIRTDAPAAAALHALFAGPVRQERAAGLRLVRSHAWGFDDLQIAVRIARMRLTRGCNSNGSTITVAGEIMPTLRQFPTVDWVKIYGPGGHTEQPTGPVDSIPFCLEP
jgi:hypothetical protein